MDIFRLSMILSNIPDVTLTWSYYETKSKTKRKVHFIR